MKGEQKKLKKLIRRANQELEWLLNIEQRDMNKVRRAISIVSHLNGQLSRMINPHDTRPEPWMLDYHLSLINKQYCATQNPPRVEVHKIRDNKQNGVVEVKQS